MGTQSPPANVLADLGQWLQQWTAFIQAQIEAQAGLPSPLLDEGGEMAVVDTAVSQESPPAHWLALFDEAGTRSLEEAAAASDEIGTALTAAGVPADLAIEPVDTAVLSTWISQLHDGILAFRRQVVPQIGLEQPEYAPETNELETAVPDTVAADPINEAEAGMPLAAKSPNPKSSAKQEHSPPGRVEMARIEGKRPFPPVPPAPFPTTSSPPETNSIIEKVIPSWPTESTQTKAPVIQRKERPPRDALLISEKPMSPAAPILPDARAENGRSTPPMPRPQPPFRSTPMVEPETDWPARQPETAPPLSDFPANAAAVPSPPPRSIKRVTRLRLNPQPQNAPSLSPIAPPSSQNPIGTAVPENSSRPEDMTRQPVIKHHIETAISSAPNTAVEMTDVGNPYPTKQSHEFEATISPPLIAPKATAHMHSPPANTKSEMVRVEKRSAINLTISDPIQTVTEPTRLLPQPPLSPVAKSRSDAPIRDAGEDERPLPSHPSSQSTTNPQLERQIAPSKPDQPIVAQDNQPTTPPKQPGYQIPPPPAPRQSPEWSVTPENRWPALPPQPQPDPNPAPNWRHQPSRRQRLDREQLGVSWNESYS